MRAATLSVLALCTGGALFAGSMQAANCQSPAETARTQAGAPQEQILVPRSSEKPSFNCAQARTAAARLICADAELARLDGELGISFQKREGQISSPDQSKLVAEQLAWIRDRNARCELAGTNTVAIEVLASSKSCMLNAIQQRIAYLAQTEATAAPAVSGGQPLQLGPPSGASSETTRFYLGCSNLDSARSALRPTCELAEALLNRNCKPLQSPDEQICSNYLALETHFSSLGTDDIYGAYMLQLERQQILQRICNADWIPIVAKECAAARARLEKLTADNKAKVARLRAQAQIDTKTAVDAASDALGTCVRNQAATLMVTNEGADAVAAAAVRLCRTDLQRAARALDYQTSVTLWFEGPQPKGCADGSLRCAEAEKAITDSLLPTLAARVMQGRAEAARATPRPGDTPVRPRAASDLGDTFGTGFFVSADGRALTNAHVVERCEQVRVDLEGRHGTARIVARDEMNDLALLATDLHPVQISNWRLSVRQGEDIVVYGFPLTGVLASAGNVAMGNVTALAGVGNDSRYLQISAPVQPGNSGGPLLDRNGNVVGIVVAKLDALGIASATGDIPQNVNFAIKASVAAAFLDAQHVAHAEGQQPAGALSTPDITERAKAVAAQVVCVR